MSSQRGRICGVVAVCGVVMLALVACAEPGRTSPPLADATATVTATATSTATPDPTPTKPPTKPGIPAATIEMGRATFSDDMSVTIVAGQAVTFDDPAVGGGMHPLVIGTQGNFIDTPGAPEELNSQSGMLFSPGTKRDITFPNAGNFPITCVAHPAMQVTITVTP